VNEAPLIAVAEDPRVSCDAAETFNAPTATLAPMIPLNATGAVVPDALRVSDCPYAVVAFTVPPKEIPEDPVVLIVVLIPPIITGTAFVTLKEVALISMAPIEVDPRVTVFVVPEAEETVSVPRARVLPTFPIKLMVSPVPALRIKDCPFAEVPSIVLLKAIAPPAALPPALVVSILTSVFNVHGPYRLTLLPLVIMFPPIATDGLFGLVVEDP
jgi:hypothetical protein